MAFVSWPWNEWLESLRGGDEQPFLEGLKRAVVTHRRLRGKSAAVLNNEYGTESYNDIVQELAIKIVSSTVIMDSQTTLIENKQIGALITVIIENMLTDLFRKRINEKRTFDQVGRYQKRNNEGQEEDEIGGFLEWRSRDTSCSPETRYELHDLAQHVRAKLTQRQSFILEHFQRFGNGSMSVLDLVELLGVEKTTINNEVARIRTIIRRHARPNFNGMSDTHRTE
jgi:hypothetical protein